MTESLLNERGEGRNPMDIPPEVLARHGHPKRPLAKTRRAYATTAAGKPDPGIYPAEVTTYRAIKEFCLGCASDAPEVRRCAITTCPFWPYRTGRNPHSAARGRAAPGTAFAGQNHD